MRNRLDYLLIVTVTLMVVNGISSLRAAEVQATTMVHIDPPFTLASTGTIFSVNVSVSDVIDLCSWQAHVYFDRNILNGSGYAEGPFLSSHGSTMFDGGIDYNATHGWIWMYCLRTWTGRGVNGSGTLGIATFGAVTGGITQLNLVNTILGNSSAIRIIHTTVDGSVEVGRHDIAITSVNPTKTVVGQGLLMNTNVTVENQGDETEVFNVTLSANATVIETRNIMLSSGNSTTLVFTWNTTGFAKGNYTQSALATPVPGETDTADNEFIDGWVIVAMVGDLTGSPSGWPDGICNMRDVALVARKFGITHPDPQYDANCDVYYDLKINMRDIALIARHFGETDP